MKNTKKLKSDKKFIINYFKIVGIIFLCFMGYNLVDLAQCGEKYKLDNWNSTEEFYDIWKDSKCRKKYMNKYNFEQFILAWQLPCFLSDKSLFFAKIINILSFVTKRTGLR